MSNTRKMGKAKGRLAHSEKDPAPESMMSRDTINIPDNVLMNGIKEYSEKDQDDLIWLLGWAGKEIKSRSRLCELLDTDWSTVIRICQGKYPAGIRNFMVKVRALRRKVQSGASARFIETIVTRKIFDVLDYALAGDLGGGKIVLISGPTRRGKTEAVQEWARRNNHGRAVYVDCPESGGLRALMYEIAQSCRVHSQRKTVDLRDRLIRSFNRRRILLVDEIGRLLRGNRRGAMAELEFLRRLHDVQHCAIALIATPVFAQEMQTGWLRDFLEQLLGRIAQPLYIPETVYRSEVKAIVQAFRKSDPPADLVALAHTIANEPGKLGILFELLRQAVALAERKKEKLQATHLQAAYQRRRQRFTWPEE